MYAISWRNPKNTWEFIENEYLCTRILIVYSMSNILLLSFAAPWLWLQIVLFVVGVVVVLWGADRLTEGAAGLASRMGVPQIVIGLTVVAMGTSMPEFFVSLMSALQGASGLAVGNVVGSNIFNSLLIVGCAAAVAPIAILPSTVRKDIPFALVASCLLLAVGIDGMLGRLDAAILFALFLYFMVTTLRGAKLTGASEKDQETENTSADNSSSVLRCLLFIVIGLAGLVVGSNVFVDNVSAVARTFGMSDALIGLTIVAGGTSLPELATSVVSARKGNSGIAIGNVLGSNVFNVLMILGITGLIAPMSLEGITRIDLTMLVLSMVLLWLFSFTKLTIERWEGWLLIVIFMGYMAQLIVQAVG